MSRANTHYVGEQIRNAVLLRRGAQDKWRSCRWYWRCLNCGVENGPSVIQKIKQASGCRKCMVYPRGASNPNWCGHELLTGRWLQQYRSDAAKKRREWSVTPEYLWALWLAQGGRCAYTGWALQHGRDASLDRIDSSRGYAPDNVQWVHQDINRMKTDLSDKRFRELCAAVALGYDVVGFDSAAPALMSAFAAGTL